MVLIDVDSSEVEVLRELDSCLKSSKEIKEVQIFIATDVSVKMPSFKDHLSGSW